MYPRLTAWYKCNYLVCNLLGMYFFSNSAQISPFIASMSAPQVLPAIRNTSPAPGDSSTVDANSPPRSPSFSRSRHSIRSESVRAPSSPSLKQPSPHSPRDRPVIGEWRSKASPGGNSSTVDADSPPRSPSFNRSRHSIMLESIRAPSPPGSLRQPSLDSPRRPFIGDIPLLQPDLELPPRKGADASCHEAMDCWTGSAFAGRRKILQELMERKGRLQKRSLLIIALRMTLGLPSIVIFLDTLQELAIGFHVPYMHSPIIRHISPISICPLLGGGFFLILDNTQLATHYYKHLLSVKHPFPSRGDIGIGA